MLVALCPVCGNTMPVLWPGSYKPRVYCSQHCRSKGTTLARLEQEEANLDEEVVNRLIKGEHVASSQAERMAAVLFLSRQLDSGFNASGKPRKSRWGTEIKNPNHDRPMTTAEIANRIGATTSTVSRYLKLLAEPQRVMTMSESRARLSILCARVVHKMTLVGWTIERTR